MSDRPTAIVEHPGYTIVENASLLGRNTLQVAARAALLIDVRKREALNELFALPALGHQPLLVLGAGSNLLFAGDWPGIVLSMATRGIAILEDRGDAALIRAEAGEAWNDVVSWSLAKGLAGLENLVLIPGLAGASPIQNIGAYGTEIGEFVETVEAYDRQARRIVRLDRMQCAFGYRDSAFKRAPDRYVITAIELVLPRERPLRTGYAGIAEELAALGVETPTPARLAEAIARIRTRKLPNPALVGNAGSFFKNPVVTAAAAEALRREHPDLPAWPAGDGAMKLAAAWLIERCGFKGLREGDAGVSAEHALVLVNHGRASGAELLALARRIVETVAQRFGVVLEPEPRIVGAS